MSKRSGKKEGGFVDKAEVKTPDSSGAESAVPYGEESIREIVEATRERGYQNFSKADKSKRNTSRKVQSPVIEIGDVAREVKSKKNNGYDENFPTRLSKNGTLFRMDQEFGLLSGTNVSFSYAYQHSRLPTNSYIHFQGAETTGHSGGFFQPPSTPAFDEADLRKKSVAQISSYKGNSGSKHAGSVGISGFDGRRENVINRVVGEVRRDQVFLHPSRTSVAYRANTEVLKFVVNNTVGYRDNTAENNSRFVGLTTDGLNMQDSISREYALKHYQAVRDAMKLAILKYEGRLNDVDSDGESEDKSVAQALRRIERINRKLRRTELKAEYHGNWNGWLQSWDPPAKRNLSPLRYNSPYSRVNVDYNLMLLNRAQFFEDVSRVYSTPIPTIKLTENAIAQKRSWKTEIKRRESAVIDQKYPATFPLKSSERISATKPFIALPQDVKLNYSALHDVMNPQSGGSVNHNPIVDNQVARVRNYEGFYADDEINNLIRRELPNDVAYIEPAISRVAEEFRNAIADFKQDGSKRRLVAPMQHDNHFTALYVTRNEDESFSIAHFDPMVDSDWQRPVHDLPVGIASVLADNFPATEIVSVSNKIQAVNDSNKENIFAENSHCGAFVIWFLTESLRGELRFSAQNPTRLESRIDEEWIDVGDFNREQSDSFGKKIRDFHASELSGNLLAADYAKILQETNPNLSLLLGVRSFVKSVSDKNFSAAENALDSLLELMKKPVSFNLENHDKKQLSGAIVNVVRNSDLKSKSEKFGKIFAAFSKANMIDHDYVERGYSILYRVAWYMDRDQSNYRGLLSSLCKKCSEKSFAAVDADSGKTSMILAACLGFFEESKIILEKSSNEILGKVCGSNSVNNGKTDVNNGKTAMTFIAENPRFTKEQKTELCKALLDRGVKVDDKTKEAAFFVDGPEIFTASPLDNMSDLLSDLPNAGPSVVEISKLSREIGALSIKK